MKFSSIIGMHGFKLCWVVWIGIYGRDQVEPSWRFFRWREASREEVFYRKEKRLNGPTSQNIGSCSFIKIRPVEYDAGTVLVH